MADYEKMYHILFNAITDTIKVLKSAQAKAEELYIKDRCKTLEFKNKK